jgi:hypothetical protein
MIFIGDVHGKINRFLPILEKYRTKRVVQIGDMGVGFPGVVLPELRAWHKWFAGNHDNPEACSGHPNNLGRFGYVKSDGYFFVSGAWSIDAGQRVPGVEWWANEELHQHEMDEAREAYLEAKPEVVATHDGPYSVITNLRASWPGPIRETRTSLFLDELLKLHRPKTWVFGHWHQSWQREIQGTRFVCLKELEAFDI